MKNLWILSLIVLAGCFKAGSQTGKPTAQVPDSGIYKASDVVGSPVFGTVQGEHVVSAGKAHWVRVEWEDGLIKDQNLGDVELFPLTENGTSLHSEKIPVLIGGRVVDKADWPATVKASMGNASCTGTVIGPKAFLIAAHCVGNGRTASFSIGSVKYSSVCRHNPGYSNNSTADWAHCVIDKEVTGIKYESINSDPSILKVGDEVLLSGFGCTQPGGGGADGQLRVGEARVTGLPSGNDNDIVTKGGAALCFGDSGGPAFKFLDPAKTKRVVISVNSRGDIRTTSYLVATHTQAFKGFFTQWKTENNVKVCGIDTDTPSCRNGDDTPPVPPLPEHCRLSWEKLNSCLWGAPRLALTKPEECQKAYGEIFACEEMAERSE